MTRADLSFDAFRELVAGIAGVDAAAVTKESSLWDELGFDSIRMVELMVATAQAGIEAPENLGDGVDTVGRAFESLTALGQGGATGPGASTPAVETRRLRLRPLGGDDSPFLYELATAPSIGWRLRSRGLPLTYEDFVAQLHRNVLAQMMVDDVRAGQRIGIVQAVEANLVDGHARITATARPERIGSGWMIEAAGLFATFLFATFPLRKLYAEIPSFAWPAVASGEGRAFTIEGTLRDHRYAGGRWWDVHVIAIHRDAWAGWGEPQLDALRAGNQLSGG